MSINTYLLCAFIIGAVAFMMRRINGPKATDNVEAIWEQAHHFLSQFKFKQALPFLVAAANRGHAEAQYRLALLYDHGTDVRRNLRKCLHLLHQSAAQGNAGAQYRLSHMHDEGQGVPVNRSEGLRWLIAAANSGYSTAQFELGILYSRGERIPKDINEAVKWLIRAAENGHGEAPVQLERIRGIQKVVSDARAQFPGAS